MKGLKQANPSPPPPPPPPISLVPAQRKHIPGDPPHIRWGGGKTREDRGLVTYVWASMRRRRPHSTIRGFAVPPAHSRKENISMGNSLQNGGWGAQRRAKKVGREGGHGLSRTEVEIRLVRDERGV